MVSAWQRSLAQSGLLAGRFYRIYDKEAAMPIEDLQVRERFEKKREEDMTDIYARMQQIEIERSYRIAAMLEQTADTIENQTVGKLKAMLDQWKSKVFLFDGIIFGLLLVLAGTALTLTDSWHLVRDCVNGLTAGETSSVLMAGLSLIFAGYIHFTIRGRVAGSMLKKIPNEFGHDHNAIKQFSQAFSKSTAGYRPLFLQKPAGWNSDNRRVLAQVKDDANDYIQLLNDQFTDPSGHQQDR